MSSRSPGLARCPYSSGTERSQPVCQPQKGHSQTPPLSIDSHTGLCCDLKAVRTLTKSQMQNFSAPIEFWPRFALRSSFCHSDAIYVLCRFMPMFLNSIPPYYTYYLCIIQYVYCAQYATFLYAWYTLMA